MLLFSHSFEFNFLGPNGLQHTRFPWLSEASLSLRGCSNSCLLSQWSDQIRSVAQSCPTLCDPVNCSRSFLLVPSILCLLPFRVVSNELAWLFQSGGQSIGASYSASVLPMNIQGWFPLGLTVLISLQSKGLSRVFSSTIVKKHQFFSAQPSLWSNSHIHTWLLEKL